MRTTAFILFLAMNLTVTTGAEPYRRTLTSVAQNLRTETWRITNQDLPLEGAKPWSVIQTTLHGGKQEGVELITVDNGALQITVIPTRGLGVLRVVAGDVRLGWDSPVKEVVHPQYVNLPTRGGLGWLEGFNEWLVRCGLEYAGHPGKDKFINNVGDEAEMDLTLHGRIGNIPASEVEVAIDRAPPHRIRVRGRVDERCFYGPKLELTTEISTEPGSLTFRIEDTLANRGAYDQEFQVIYHANYGPPLLEKNARFVSAVQRVTPLNAHAAKGVQGYERYVGPTPGFVEQVYCLHPYADASGRTKILLQNAQGNRAVTMAFAIAQLPYVTLWKNTTALEEGYVTGLEPGTGFPFNRRMERKFGRVPKLKAGEARPFVIDYAVLADAQAVAGAVAEIDRIRAGRPTTVDPEPVKLD
jgi:hypothetical protein